MTVPRIRPRGTGVYRISFEGTSWFYIGSTSSDFRVRRNEHESDLRLAKHGNRHMQRVYNKHGPESFRFRVESIASPDDAIVVEQWFLDFHQGSPWLMNQAKTVENGMKGRRHTKEVARAISKKLKERYRCPDALARNRMSQESVNPNIIAAKGDDLLVFPSQVAAANHFGCRQSAVWQRIKIGTPGSRYALKGWTFKREGKQ